MSWRIGVDIGGTFTDVAVLDEVSGRIGIVKTSTTPRDFVAGVVHALKAAMARHGVPASDVVLLSHATTVVTNAILEEKGAKTALITTRGFRDVLELRRSARARLYDRNQEPPAVLVPRHRRFEITERVGADGEVVIPLEEDELDGIAEEIGNEGVEAVAVCLLFSFLHDDHERRIGARLRAALPGVPVFLSCDVLPELKEFERTSTTAVCAYVGPILASYVERLEQATRELKLPPLHIMGSSGGFLDVTESMKMPAMAVESGPAAGVVAAAFIGRQLDETNLISFDMGGTTAKASLIRDGRVEVTSEYEVGADANVTRWMHGTGHPIKVPVIDLAEVSAGGGSIAWIDSGGGMHVGPRSAGAEPGPVCYGQGGREPTVTDCDLILGYLNPEYFLGGELILDAAAAEATLRERVAEPLGLSLLEAAAGVVAVVDHNMAEALRIVSVERGHDPRDFSLVAFGGAGPVHAVSLARELDIPKVIVPPIPGGFSALGLVATDLRREYVRTFYKRLDEVPPDEMSEALSAMEEMGRDMLVGAGVPEVRRKLQRAADVRYTRQAYELTVPIEDGDIGAAHLAKLAEAFHARHRTTYGHDSPNEPLQVVNLRVSAIGVLESPVLKAGGRGSGAIDAARRGTRQVYFKNAGTVSCGIFDRDRLPWCGDVPGPAIIEAADTTIVVPLGWRVGVDPKGFLIMERSDDG
ncbi:MAG: hydantoinase/oxoprolinase family protein [Rhodospirillaceae bacterium]|nr:hydantoinase/oxoprolinase family protein [Rhodospirillaceae bacterium]